MILMLKVMMLQSISTDTPQISTRTKSETFSINTNPKNSTTSTPVIDITEPLNFLHIVLESYLSLTHPSSSTKIFSTLYDWLRHNTKPEFPTSPKHGS